jgi:hypothetical protein
MNIKSKSLFVASLIAGITALLVFQTAFAHTTIHVGDYDVEIGWVDEPSIVGQRNAIVVNVENTTAPDAEVDVSNLAVSVSYGGQTKALELEPLSEDTTNQYIAPILPTVAGQYTVQLRGKLDSMDINQDVQPEEVAASEELAFPNPGAAQEQNSGLNWSQWLSIIGIISGLTGLVLGLLAFQKTR